MQAGTVRGDVRHGCVAMAGRGVRRPEDRDGVSARHRERMRRKIAHMVADVRHAAGGLSPRAAATDLHLAPAGRRMPTDL
jgi:hypothetical protein